MLTILEAPRILSVVSHFNLSVLANELLSVSLCHEIDNVFGAVRTCFDHVLSKFSGFSWERILSLQVSIWWCKFNFKLEILEEFFWWIRLGVLRILKNYILPEIPKTRSMDFGLLYKNDKRENLVEWRSHHREPTLLFVNCKWKLNKTENLTCFVLFLNLLWCYYRLAFHCSLLIY